MSRGAHEVNVQICKECCPRAEESNYHLNEWKGVYDPPETNGWECVKGRKVAREERGEVEKITWVTSVEILSRLFRAACAFHV
jgi:hypothetical protein